ncbi:hypothetical protein Syun_027603 [Stephania yunnanensis]|uniref:Uncharacterized protein n=1 Tax=Stephania yunnanensis TaxID=152371 RepID=A0AAP0EJ84_9MAGN
MCNDRGNMAKYRDVSEDAPRDACGRVTEIESDVVYKEEFWEFEYVIQGFGRSN